MKSEMTPASFCCGLIVCNKSSRRLISKWDSEDVAFMKKKVKKRCGFGKMANWSNLENKQANHPILKKKSLVLFH